MKVLCLAVSLAILLAVPFQAEEKKADDGFVPMFNGKDLTGWVNVNCAPDTFFVKDGEIITTGKPKGYLRTAKQYENFIAEFDWMHVNTKEVGNSGFFVWGDPLPAVGTPYTRGIEVQVLVNLTLTDKKSGAVTATSQGDLFSIQGATCKPDRPHPLGWARCLPSENHCKGGGEWNHYKVVAKDGAIKLHVNGKEVSGISECRPRKGYLALESEGAECHFRNLKIKEMPSSNPKKEDCAAVAEGHQSLFNGLDLTGWKADAEGKKHWTAKDGVLHYEGAANALNWIKTGKPYGDSEFIVDFRFPKKGARNFIIYAANLSVKPDGAIAFLADKGPPTNETAIKLKPAGQWNRLGISVKGTDVAVSVNGVAPVKGKPLTAQERSLDLTCSGEMEFRNLFVRELK